MPRPLRSEMKNIRKLLISMPIAVNTYRRVRAQDKFFRVISVSILQPIESLQIDAGLMSLQ